MRFLLLFSVVLLFSGCTTHGYTVLSSHQGISHGETTSSMLIQVK